jgi:hypothetical protein
MFPPSVSMLMFTSINYSIINATIPSISVDVQRTALNSVIILFTRHLPYATMSIQGKGIIFIILNHPQLYDFYFPQNSYKNVIICFSCLLQTVIFINKVIFVMNHYAK